MHLPVQYFFSRLLIQDTLYFENIKKLQDLKSNIHVLQRILRSINADEEVPKPDKLINQQPKITPTSTATTTRTTTRTTRTITATPYFTWMRLKKLGKLEN